MAIALTIVIPPPAEAQSEYAGCEVASTAADIAAIPPAIHAIIAGQYRSWKVATTCKDVAKSLMYMKLTTPSVAIGDFDNDGSGDYAVRLERRARREGSLDFIVVAFFNRGHAFLPVFAGSAGEYVGTVRQGTRDYDYDRQAYFTHTTDAICTGIIEKSGWAFIHQRGRFRVVYNVD